MVSCMCQHANEAKVPAALYAAVGSSVLHELLLVRRAQKSWSFEDAADKGTACVLWVCLSAGLMEALFNRYSGMVCR